MSLLRYLCCSRDARDTRDGLVLVSQAMRFEIRGHHQFCTWCERAVQVVGALCSAVDASERLREASARLLDAPSSLIATTRGLGVVVELSAEACGGTNTIAGCIRRKGGYRSVVRAS
jgi:hypothetical protein